MRTPLIDRRDFLKAAGATFLASLAPDALAATLATDAVYATAFQRRDGAYGAAVLSENGRILHEIDLPDRGHDVTFDPVSRRSVVFARQPGTFATIFDHTGRSAPMTIGSIEGRHFYGHGVFSPDGTLLYATENDFDNAAGVIGVYDATDGFRRIGEFPTFGVGPHELLLLEDGHTLAIANGGIETHIETGREKLNLDTMMPSLAFVDSTNGKLVSQHKQSADLHKLSIRHLVQDARGTVWFGCQWEGADADTPDLIGCAGFEAPLRIIAPPKPMGVTLAGYIGAVAASGDGRLIAASAPRAGRLVYVDSERFEVVGETQLLDSCGITGASDESFVMTSGMGIVQRDTPDHSHLETATFPGRSFDNHLRMIS